MGRLLAGRDAEHLFDVGANVGQTARKLRRVFPQSRIWSFEPFPDAHASLHKSLVGDERAEARAEAVAEAVGTRTFHVNRYNYNHSLLGADERGVDWARIEHVDAIDVPVTTVDAFCAERGIEHLGLLKTDAEGGDLLVLRGAREMLAADRISCVYTEALFVPIFAGQAWFHEVCELLHGTWIPALRPVRAPLRRRRPPEDGQRSVRLAGLRGRPRDRPRHDALTAVQRTLEPEYMDTRREADEYESMDHAQPNAAFVQRAVELGARGRILDVGTGPGHVPVLLCRQLPQARVVAVDAARTMLDHARRKRADSPHAARIALVRADAKRLPFPAASFNGVVSNTILHHIPEPAELLRELARVAMPGAMVLVRDLFRPRTAERAKELTALHCQGQTELQRELFRASLHAALTPDELRACAHAAGLGSAELVVDSDRHVSLQRAARP